MDRAGGEADLVVDNKVDGTARLVPFQAGEPETFRDDALPGEGRIAVQQQRQAAGPLIVLVLVLLGARLAEHDRIDHLQVRRIGGQRQVHVVAVELAVRRGAKVVLDVSRPLHLVRRRGTALELVEYGAERLAHDAGQHIEPATVRHADDDVLHAQRAAALDDLFERRDQRFAAIQTEAFGAGILDVEKVFEALRLDQLVEDRLLAFRRKRDPLVRPLDTLLQPGLLDRIGNVRDLDTKRRTIGPLEDLQDFVQRGGFHTENHVEIDLAVHVLRPETVGLRIKLGVAGLLAQLERIQLGDQVAAHPVGADHHQGAHRIHGRPPDLVLRKRLSGFLRLAVDLRGDFAFVGGPVTVQRADQFAIGVGRPVGARPGRPPGLLDHIVPVVLEIGEELPPVRVDRVRVLLILCVEIFDKSRVAAIKERGAGQHFVHLVLCHYRIGKIVKSCPPFL